MQSPFTFFFAFIVVLALIGAVAWGVRRFANNRLGANPNRGRMPRLAVIDAAAVDGRRRLVLVRRDNIEHLLMIGGPTDVVIEPNIVRAALGRDTAARGNGHEPVRATPPLETAWPLQPINEPLPVAPPPLLTMLAEAMVRPLPSVIPLTVNWIALPPLTKRLLNVGCGTVTTVLSTL